MTYGNHLHSHQQGEVARTEYSLDEGVTWETYTESFQITGEGVTNIHYRSTDLVGNVEETKRTEVKIDRTAPTARVGLDPYMRKIAVSGSDDQSDVTIERDETDISPSRNFWWGFFSRNVPTQFRIHTIITDEAGHVAEVVFTEERKYGTNFTLSDFSVTRDGDALDVSDVYASYQAVPGRWGRDYSFLSAFLKTDHNMILARYFGRRDKTWIVSILEEVAHKEWRSGMVVPMLEAGDNGIEIIWN